MAVNSGSSALGGWLMKQGPKGPKFWKSRYFVLWNDSELHYSSTDQNVNPQTSLGYIDLRRATSCDNDEKNSTESRFVFSLRLPERTYILAAASDAERAYWVLRIGMFVSFPKEMDPRGDIERLKQEIAKLRSDIDFESQKHGMQITDLRKQVEQIKKEKDREIADLRDLILKQNVSSSTSSAHAAPPEREKSVRHSVSIFRK